MTTSQRYFACFAFVVGATIAVLLVGAAPASADPMGPSPGCAAPMVPIVGECAAGPPVPLLPPPVQPWEVVPPLDPWQDPVLSGHQIDDSLNQLLPDEWIIGEIPDLGGPFPLPELPPGTVIIPGGHH